MPRITETEWKIMRVVWARHPITANEIIEQLLAQDPAWHPKTVRSLLTRLVRKKALGYESQGRSYVYEPRVSEADCLSAASDSFLDRVFGGSLTPLVAHFIEHRKLTRKQINELKALLDQGGKP